jgi:hypothetical protein
MAIKKTATTKPRTDAVNSVGPLGGLAAGVIAGVNTAPRTPAPAPNSAITMPPAMTAAFTPRPTTPTTSSVASVGPLGGLQAGVIAGVQAPTGYTETGQPITQPVVTTPIKPVIEKDIAPETKDAFEELGMLLKSWGLESLADTYTRLMVSGKTAAQALTMLKYSKDIDPATGQPYNAAYTKRFAGNAARIAGGMNAYDERTYLTIENAYEETLQRYGLSNMISTDRAANQAKYADYMGKGIAPTEFAGRIQLVADRVINMDKDIKDTFKAYYPSLTDTDLVTYFLNPKETMPVLEAKVQAAEIGGAAKAQSLNVSEARAMELSKFGINLPTARTGYGKVAEALPTGKKLSDIYGEEGISYTQQVAEDEYLKEDAQAKLKRNRLASKERAMFSGQSGVNENSLQRGYSSAF